MYGVMTAKQKTCHPYWYKMYCTRRIKGGGGTLRPNTSEFNLPEFTSQTLTPKIIIRGTSVKQSGAWVQIKRGCSLVVAGEVVTEARNCSQRV